ncbi:MAG TPA: hypothetical protein VKR53_09880 [Puia sp.]|nr:hypothetical protein [Puia sp.]
MKEPTIFSDALRNKAISSFDDELAWKLDDIFDAIDEIINSGYAILGGDAWAIVSTQSEHIPLTYINPNEIAIGIIRGGDNIDYVFNWHCDKKKSEGWEDYLKRTKDESIKSIKKLNTEQLVADEFKDSIYYNLVYINEEGHNKLVK